MNLALEMKPSEHLIQSEIYVKKHRKNDIQPVNMSESGPQ